MSSIETTVVRKPVRSTLPPTLFRLPHLHPRTTPSISSLETSDAVVPTVAVAAAVTAAPTIAAAIAAAPDATAAPDHDATAAKELGSPPLEDLVHHPATVDPVAISVAASQPSTVVSMVAATLMANKTVAGLLVLVVTAAWISGQSQISGQRHAPGTRSPRHPQTTIASTKNKPTTPAVAIDIGKALPTALASAKSSAADKQIEMADEYIVELQLPAATPTESSIERPVQPAANEFFGRGQTPVQTVATRHANPLFNALSAMSELPSHGPNESAGETATAPSKPRFRQSQTPLGIDDWSQYLPSPPR